MGTVRFRGRAFCEDNLFAWLGRCPKDFATAYDLTDNHDLAELLI